PRTRAHRGQHPVPAHRLRRARRPGLRRGGGQGPRRPGGAPRRRPVRPFHRPRRPARRRRATDGRDPARPRRAAAARRAARARARAGHDDGPRAGHQPVPRPSPGLSPPPHRIATMARPTPLSGFPEWLPAERAVETYVLDTLRRTFELHGFAGIETRAVEPVEELLRKGETSKEVYVV